MRPHSLAGAQAGQALGELLVIVPFLLLLTLAAVDMGRYLYNGIEIGNAARAGVQYGAQSMLTSTDSAGMSAAAGADSDIAGVSASASHYCTCDRAPGTQYDCNGMPACAAGDHPDVYVKVQASKDFVPLIAYPGIPPAVTISRTATQQVTP